MMTMSPGRGAGWLAARTAGSPMFWIWATSSCATWVPTCRPRASSSEVGGVLGIEYGCAWDPGGMSAADAAKSYTTMRSGRGSRSPWYVSRWVTVVVAHPVTTTIRNDNDARRARLLIHSSSRRRYHAVVDAVGPVRRLKPRIATQVVGPALNLGRDTACGQRGIDAAHHVRGAGGRAGAGGDAGRVTAG